MTLESLALRTAKDLAKAEALYASAKTWRELEAAQEAVSLAITNVSFDLDMLDRRLKDMADDLRERQYARRTRKKGTPT